MNDRPSSSNIEALSNAIRSRGSSTRQWAVGWLVRERGMSEQSAVKVVDDAIARSALSDRAGVLTAALQNPEPMAHNLNPRGSKMASKKSSKKSSAKKSSKHPLLSPEQQAALEEGKKKLAAIQAGKVPAPAAVPAIIKKSSKKSAKKASSKKASAKRASAKKASVKKTSVKRASVKKTSVKRASAKAASRKSAKRASRKSAKRASRKSAKRASAKAASRKSAKRASKKSAKRASRKSAKRASRKSAKRASAKAASRKSAKRASRKSAKRASRKSAKRASRKSAKRASKALAVLSPAVKARVCKAAKRASRKSAKRASVKAASRKSPKRASKKAAKRVSRKSAKRVSAKAAPRKSAKRKSPKRASKKAAKRASRKSTKRVSAKRASARKASRRTASPRKAGAKKVSRRPDSKAARKGTKKMKKPRSPAQLAALAKGRAKRAEKSASKPKSAKAKSAKRKSAKAASGKKHRKISKKASAYKSLSRAMHLLAPKPRKPGKGRKPSAKAMHNVPTGKYVNKQGAQILIRRSYSQNPTYDVKDLAVGGGGLFLGVILADLADRFVATMAPKGQKDALTGELAAAAIRANASGKRLGVAGGATALLGVGAYLLRDKSPMAAFGVGGLAVAFGGKFLNMLVTDVLMPRIFKPAAAGAAATFGDRFYYDKKLPPPASGATELPYGFRRPGYQGLPGFLGAPQTGRRPFEQAPANVGPVASGAVGCGSCGSGATMAQQFAGFDLGEVFPSAKTTCNTCGAVHTIPGRPIGKGSQGPKDNLEVMPVAPTPEIPRPIAPVRPVMPTPLRTGQTVIPTPEMVQPRTPPAPGPLMVQPQAPSAAASSASIAQVQAQNPSAAIAQVQAQEATTIRNMASLMAASQLAVKKSNAAGAVARPRR